MLAEAHFQYVARQICGLLTCDSVSLFLGCPESALRHPHLDLFSTSGYRCFGYCGVTDGTALLQDEHVRALCDLAIQTGHMQWTDQLQIMICATHIRSLIIAPLERSEGILGLLLITGPHSGAFDTGAHLLLHGYLPYMAQRIEQDLLQLYHAQERRDRQGFFISMVGHELRTPLTAIKGYAVLLQAYGLPDRLHENDTSEMALQCQREYLDIILEQTNHLEVLISDLLDISRIQAGRLALRYTYVDVGHLCQRVVQLVQYKTKQQQSGRYSIRCILAPELPFAWADSDRVQQVLSNLVENAIKYSPDGGMIEVMANTSVAPLSLLHDATHVRPLRTLTQEMPTIHITVRDQGIGIPLQQQSQLFKPFSRLEHPLSESIPGVGLGLYITRKLVEAMGGSVALTSSESEGTSVTFTLPTRMPDHISQATSVTLTRTEQQNLSKQSPLI